MLQIVSTINEVLTIECSNVVIEALHDLCVQMHIRIAHLVLLLRPK